METHCFTHLIVCYPQRKAYSVVENLLKSEAAFLTSLNIAIEVIFSDLVSECLVTATFSIYIILFVMWVVHDILCNFSLYLKKYVTSKNRQLKAWQMWQEILIAIMVNYNNIHGSIHLLKKAGQVLCGRKSFEIGSYFLDFAEYCHWGKLFLWQNWWCLWHFAGFASYM